MATKRSSLCAVWVPGDLEIGPDGRLYLRSDKSATTENESFRPTYHDRTRHRPFADR